MLKCVRQTCLYEVRVTLVLRKGSRKRRNLYEFQFEFEVSRLRSRDTFKIFVARHCSFIYFFFKLKLNNFEDLLTIYKN